MAQQQALDAQEQVGFWLAAACSRHSVQTDIRQVLVEHFPTARVLRMSFGLQSKTMVNVNITLPLGTCHVSFIPIHPTAAAASVLQDTPTVVVRQPDKNSPLWDQEDMWQREGCATLTVVSMPFYWPPREGDQLYGHPLPRPQRPEHQPTFGAMSIGSPTPLPEHEVAMLLNLATRTGRHVCPHISALLASLEAHAALPSEPAAQNELRRDDDGEGADGDDIDNAMLGFDAAMQQGMPPELLALPSAGAAPAPAPPLAPLQQQGGAGGTAAAAEEAGEPLTPRADAAGPMRQPPLPPPPCAPVIRFPPQRRRQADGVPPTSAGAVPSRSSTSALAPEIAADDVEPSRSPSSSPSSAAAAATAGAAVKAAEGSGDPHPPGNASPTWGPPQFRGFASERREKAFLEFQGVAQAKLDLLVLFLAAVVAPTLAEFHNSSSAGPLRILAITAGVPLLLMIKCPHLYRSVREMLLMVVGVHGAVCAAYEAPQWMPSRHDGIHLLSLLLRATGLDYLIAAPLLLQVRAFRALHMQALSLAILLPRLPYSLGRMSPPARQPLDTIHLLLLQLLMAAGALGGVALLWLREQGLRHRFERRACSGGGDGSSGDGGGGARGGGTPASRTQGAPGPGACVAATQHTSTASSAGASPSSFKEGGWRQQPYLVLPAASTELP